MHGLGTSKGRGKGVCGVGADVERETSVRKSSTSLEGGAGTIEAMEGGAPSTTLSARVAISSRLFASPE